MLIKIEKIVAVLLNNQQTKERLSGKKFLTNLYKNGDKKMKLLISLLATLSLIAGCGNENEDDPSEQETTIEGDGSDTDSQQETTTEGDGSDTDSQQETTTEGVGSDTDSTNNVPDSSSPLNAPLVDSNNFPNLRASYTCEKNGVTNTYELRFFDGEWTNCRSSNDGSSCCGFFLIGENEERTLITATGLSYAQCQAIIPPDNTIGSVYLFDNYKDRAGSNCTRQ